MPDFRSQMKSVWFGEIYHTAGALVTANCMPAHHRAYGRIYCNPWNPTATQKLAFANLRHPGVTARNRPCEQATHHSQGYRPGLGTSAVAAAFTNNAANSRTQLRQAWLDTLDAASREAVDGFLVGKDALRFNLPARAGEAAPDVEGGVVNVETPSALRVLVWGRNELNEPYRNSTAALLTQLKDLIWGLHMVPVFVGQAHDGFAYVATPTQEQWPDEDDQAVLAAHRSIQLTVHWADGAFNVADEQRKTQRQLYMFDRMLFRGPAEDRKGYGVVAQVGLKSGAMDGPALCTLPTCSIQNDHDTKKERLRKWAAAGPGNPVVPGYFEISTSRFALPPVADRVAGTINAEGVAITVEQAQALENANQLSEVEANALRGRLEQIRDTALALP